MEYKKAKDGSYFHNNIVVGRKGDPSEMRFYSKPGGESVVAFLNGYAIIPIEEYCRLKGSEYDGSMIAECDGQIHGVEEDVEVGIVECPVAKELISAVDCFDYSGSHIDTCMSCEHFKPTRI